MEFGALGLYFYFPILVIVLIPVWAAYRLILCHERTHKSPTISSYNAINPEIDFTNKGKYDVIFSISNLKSYRSASRIIDIMKIAGALCLSLFCFYSFVVAFHHNINRGLRRQASVTNSSSVLVDFELYKPVEFDPPSQECDKVVLLMEHSFGYSYGQPFVGSFTPPDCDFDTVRINFTVTSRGRQFDRLALMYLNDTEVFRTSTAEPTTNGIVWTYIKEMSQYLTLWKSPQKVIFDLGNLIDSTYTGPFNTTLTASFTKENSVRTADLILPISARRSVNDSASAFNVPSDNATVDLTFPNNVQRAVVSISACGQSEEEFWWSSVLNQDIDDFDSTVGVLYGFSPFREIQLYIDGVLAGVIWPFPVIFTGGVAPGFWRPIVGIDAFDLREPEIDVSPFLPLLLDGKAHSFEIKVAGLNTPTSNGITLSETVNSYWVVTGKVFVYLGHSEDSIKSTGVPPSIHAPDPEFSFSRNLVSNSTANETLSYSVYAHRTLTITSGQTSWIQDLSFSNYGYLNQEGLSQRNIQNTTGISTVKGIGLSGGVEEYITTFSYPLDVNNTYALTASSTTIDASMDRGLSISSSGGLGISTYTLTSGPVYLQTRQWGDAHYYAAGGSSYSSGETTQEFSETSGGTTYSTYVQAVNGTVVTPNSQALSLPAQNSWFSAGGRPSIRSILGRGPN
ncbi:conserved hypothetical protein [Talaromyces stipitatus ATCC 10500]|uniref:Peptide N-acetyl-beta-D-glucosaminyl asparaginase amidase A N-terminal domain-containing protein n=1 Tax=Talaromyces stipitatus (strain ATCC 10500 / CBS 375.48 / QM 6759 / NRRL 1006) TaxID=441959 RepID=B8M7F8_TALSN|nr:uncharacterized protein TSTA_036040 [Talaromyces stipitatus ATCC 10500]EED20378.1 conserved hypothetical protein [Talaromyces stipitatus ATCC 10500]